MSLSLWEIDTDDEEDWCEDIGTANLQCESIVPFHSLQCRLIIECTDLDPETWIRLYAERFRDIVNSDPNLTAAQVKRILYRFESHYK